MTKKSVPNFSDLPVGVQEILTNDPPPRIIPMYYSFYKPEDPNRRFGAWLYNGIVDGLIFLFIWWCALSLSHSVGYATPIGPKPIAKPIVIIHP